MRCISLWQPYASLMVHGLKRIETRSAYFAKMFSTPGPLLIHAAKKWNRELYDICTAGPFRDALEQMGHKLPVRQPNDASPRPDGMPFGCLVGMVDVRAVLSTDRVKWHPDSKRYFAFDQFAGQLVISEAEKAFGDYADGRIAIVTDNPVVFPKPVPLTGRQALFVVADHVYRDQLAAAAARHPTATA